MDTVFFPGIDGGGEEQWPVQADGLSAPGRRLFFIDPVYVDGGPSEHAEHALGLVTDDVHIVGHSYGGIAACLAAAQAGLRATSLVLFEPACMTIALDRPVTKALLSRLIPTLDKALNKGLSDAELAVCMFGTGGLKANPADPNLARVGANFRSWGPMWAYPIDVTVFGRVPTLVVTGGWNDSYEEIAGAIAETGARHIVLTGFGHRPQDHPKANALIEDFWNQAS